MVGRGAYFKQKYGGGGRGRFSGNSRGGFQHNSSGGQYADHGGGFGGGPWASVGSSDGSLKSLLLGLEGKPYPAYKDARGEWEVEGFKLIFDEAQTDPYAPPSHFRLRLPQSLARFPSKLYTSPIRNSAVCDFITREFFGAISEGGILGPQDAPQGSWSDSKPDDIRIDCPGQHIIPRSSVVINNAFVEARCTIALPGRGRRVEGRRAAHLLCEVLPNLVRRTMQYESLDKDKLQRHVESNEDQEYLRDKLASLGLVAFVINGACLPRASGVDDRPMTLQQERNLVLFESPPTMEVEVELPNRGKVRGMGIRRGVTIIVGGGFHGKSTLLGALQFGVYNKIPGDGREFVVADPNAVKIRAEDGRVVTSVDISSFITNLPFGKSTNEFSSQDASGSTSQAANIIEAVEMGATTLLVDEDTCATNFMIRDARMQALVAKEKEPITPFLHKVRPLLKDHNVSTIMVIGGCGDFFDVADTVLLIDKYQAHDVTHDAKTIASEFNCQNIVDKFHIQTPLALESLQFGRIRHRTIRLDSLIARGKVRIQKRRAIVYGSTEIDLSGMEQLAESSQTRAISNMIRFASDSNADNETLKSIVEKQFENLRSKRNGGFTGEYFDSISLFNYPVGNLVLPRPLEVGFAINRLRSLCVTSMCSS